MCAGRQAHDEHARRRIAETGDGLTPVFPIAIRAPLLPRDLLAVGDQARAAGTSDNIAVEDSKPGHAVITPHRRDVFLSETWVTAWLRIAAAGRRAIQRLYDSSSGMSRTARKPKGLSHRLTLLSSIFKLKYERRVNRCGPAPPRTAVLQPEVAS